MAKKADEKTATPAEPSKRGAPEFVWTEEIETEIFSRIMAGESVLSLTGPNKESGMPSQTTLYKRLLNDEEFAKKYTRAKEFLADHEFDEIREIADNASNDWMERNDPDNPGYVLNHDHVQRSKLRVDVRKWRASKLAPKKYGDRTALEVAGDGGGPLVVQVVNYGGPVANPDPE